MVSRGRYDNRRIYLKDYIQDFIVTEKYLFLISIKNN